jgi:hypothetical protein
LLRNMLLAERHGRLWICQAVPRAWLADGQEIELRGAPDRVRRDRPQRPLPARVGSD